MESGWRLRRSTCGSPTGRCRSASPFSSRICCTIWHQPSGPSQLPSPRAIRCVCTCQRGPAKSASPVPTEEWTHYDLRREPTGWALCPLPTPAWPASIPQPSPAEAGRGRRHSPSTSFPSGRRRHPEVGCYTSGPPARRARAARPRLAGSLSGWAGRSRLGASFCSRRNGGSPSGGEMITFSHPQALLLLFPVLVLSVLFWWSGYINLSRRRSHIALGIRLAMLLALVLGLAGVGLRLAQTREATVIVADLSAS